MSCQLALPIHAPCCAESGISDRRPSHCSPSRLSAIAGPGSAAHFRLCAASARSLKGGCCPSAAWSFQRESPGRGLARPGAVRVGSIADMSSISRVYAGELGIGLAQTGPGMPCSLPDCRPQPALAASSCPQAVPPAGNSIPAMPPLHRCQSEETQGVLGLREPDRRMGVRGDGRVGGRAVGARRSWVCAGRGRESRAQVATGGPGIRGWAWGESLPSP